MWWLIIEVLGLFTKMYFKLIFNRGYERPPKPREERLQEAAYHFATGILSALKSSSVSPFYVHMYLDVWRYLTRGKGTPSQHRGHVLYSKHDFVRFSALPEHWWYYLDEHGEGKAADFPIKIKPVLTWSPAHHIRRAGRLVKASQFPMEKISVTIVKRACNLHNLDQWKYLVLLSDLYLHVVLTYY